MIEEKRVVYPMRSPRNWHGMTVGVWFRLLASNRFDVSPTRVPMAAAISLFSLANSLMSAVSEHLYGHRIPSTPVEPPPLFVLGHWRTGTTLLHELLVKDDRFTYPTTYQCMTPDHFLWTDRLFSRRLNWLMPSKRPMDDMALGMDRPQEDEFALVNLGLGSPYLEWAFPNRGHNFDEFLSLHDLNEQSREHWKAQFEDFVKRIYFHNPKRVVLKSPTHTARVGTMLDIFPEARFIHVVRNPLKSIPSTVLMWTRVIDAIALQIRRGPISIDRVLDVFEKMYARFELERKLIPPGHLIEVRYEDLVAQPWVQLERIYGQLGLGDLEHSRPGIEQYLASVSNYQPNRIQLTDEVKEKIRSRCADYIKRYGYEEPAT